MWVTIILFMTFNQSEYTVRCEWGERGVAELAPISDVVVIVDVISFSTSVEIATSRGAIIFPYRGPGDTLGQFARERQALVAGAAGTPYSLQPRSLTAIPAGTRLVLPSPNGSMLSSSTGGKPTLAGCLRNACAVAKAAQRMGNTIAVIPAGERWRADGSLRPGIEDWLGAGAIIHHLHGKRSPEAELASAAFLAVQERLVEWLHQCSSGKEHVEQGAIENITLAASLDVSDNVPLLGEDGGYRQTLARR